MATIEDQIAIALNEKHALIEWVLFVRAQHRRGRIDADEMAAMLKQIEQAQRGNEQHLSILRNMRGDL